MKEVYKVKADNMLKLYGQIEKDFKWVNHLSKHFAALTYILKDKEYNQEKIKDTIKEIKKQTNIFSYYRGNSLFIIAMLLSSQYNNPVIKVEQLFMNDKKMKEAGFKNSIYLPIANYALLITGEENNVDKRIHKAFSIYTGIKKNHPWITSGDDYPLCVLLSSSEEDSLIGKIENCYRLLNSEGFSKGNGLQMLSHILSLSNEEDYIITKRCRDIFNKLKDEKLKIYSSYYASLGLISLLYESEHTIVQDIVDVAMYLRGQKKYKWLGKGMNVLIASAIVGQEFIKDNKKELLDTAIGVSVETLIAAQTSVIIAGVTASTAAASASS